MKKFNKSKVIIPALAMIALSTAASATGTVAWFTANRATQVTTGSFVAFDDNRGLSIIAHEGTGTNVSSNIVTPTGSLTDASYDFTNVWTLAAKDTNNDANSYDNVTGSLASGAKDASGKDVFYAVQWTYTIGLTNTKGKLAKSIDVMFDLSSTFAESADLTAPGFRIAMQCDNDGDHEYDDVQFVFGNNRDSNADNHVTGTGATNIAGFGNAYLTTATEGDNYQKGTDDDETNKNRSDYLGTITAAAGTLALKCTAWYEGTDPHVVSDNITETMSGVSATLKFYARNSTTPVATGD